MFGMTAFHYTLQVLTPCVCEMFFECEVKYNVLYIETGLTGTVHKFQKTAPAFVSPFISSSNQVIHV